jgi:hypothetical protein
MPANNRVLTTNRQKLFSTVILDLDFTSLAAGSYSPYINFKTPCASSSRTVQTGKSTVTSNINADDALIGREQDYWDLGLVIEGPVTNYCNAPRTFTGGLWQAGVNETFVAQAAGTDSPDSAYNSVAFSTTAVAGSGSRYLAIANTGPNTLSFWRRQYAPSLRKAGNYSAAGNGFAIESGNVPVTWEKAITIYQASTSSTCVSSPIASTNAAVTGYSVTFAASGRFDFWQWEAIRSICHEFYDGSKLGGGLTIDASKVIVNGRLSMYWKGRPKGSVNGNNPWTYNPWIVGKDANNNILFDAITGFVSVTILGLTYTTTIPINFSRGSVVEIWVEAGGTKLNTVVKTKIDGIITTLGISTSPQGYFPNDGLLGICCNPLNLTTSQFESWINRVVFYANNVIPDTFATDPYQMFYDFTGLTVGSPATPSGLTFTCATAGRTVQTSDSTVVSGIAANAIRVGKENSKWMNGMVLEGAVTNLLANPRTMVGWSAGTGTFYAQSVGTNSPDGTVTSSRHVNTSGQFSVYTNTTAFSGKGNYTQWLKKNASGSRRRLKVLKNVSNAYDDSSPALAAWDKRTVREVSELGNFTAQYMAHDGRNTIPLPSPYATAGDVLIDMCQAEASALSHEFIDGAKATESLSVPVSSAVVNGRLGFYCRFRPKFSSTGGTNPTLVSQCLWYIDNSNYALWYPNSTGTLAVVINGISRTPSVNTGAFNRGDDLEFWLEAGNGQTICWFCVNGRVTVLPFAIETMPSLSSSGTLLTLCYGNGNYILEAWHATFRTYKPGLRPDWQDPNILWTADFTKLQAGTDTKPAGMTVLCATAARTVQVGDNAVVSAIAADVPLIGRENSTWNLGAVLEGAVNNIATTPRTFTGWSAGDAETFNAQAAGIDSPDNTVTSANSAITSGRYSRSVQSALTSALTVSFWRKQLSASPKRAIFSNLTGTRKATESGNVSTNWEKAALSVPAAAGTVYFVPVDGRNSFGSTVPYPTPTDASAVLDMVNFETGSIPHEFTVTSKAGTVHSIPAATIVSSNRLSLTYTMRPKGSISGTNPWTTSVYLWRQDASNYCEITTAGIFNSVIAGSSKSSSTAITFSRGDRIEWWYSGGGGTLATIIKARVNGGAIQTFTLPIQGTIPNSGTIGLGCDWNAPSTNSFEGWYEFIAAYVTGTSPTWAA